MSYLADMCFLCLKKNINLQSVLVQDIDGIVFNEKLRYLFSEIIDSTPDSHKLSCSECLEKLRISYEFKQLVIYNNTVFRNYIEKLECQHKSHQQLQIALERLKDEVNLPFTRDFTTNVDNGKEEHNTNSLKIPNVNFNLTSCQLTSKENIATFTKPNCQTKNTNLNIENKEIIDHLSEETLIKQEMLVDDEFSTDYFDEQLKTHNQSCQFTNNENVASFTKLSCQREETNLKTEDIGVVNYLPEEIFLKEEPLVEDDSTSNYSDEESNESEDNFECQICQLSFSSPIYLKNHACLCNKKAQKPEKNVNQQIRDDTISNDSFKCHICDNVYTIKSLYDRHLMVKHCIYDEKGGMNEENCENSATKNSESPSISSNSENTDQPKPDDTKIRRYKCTECYKAFYTRSLLDRHSRIHNGEKPYECLVCHKTFSEAFNLTTHKFTHSKEKPHQCEVCNKTFKQKGGLIRHKLSHSNVRPYQCSVCNKTFTQSSNLTAHMRIHTGEKPYECDICEFKSSDRSHLIYHIRTHTGEKPFRCKHCEKSFTSSSYLNVHLKKVHA